MIHKIIVVLAEHKIGDVNRQLRVPYVIEAPRQNLDHLAEPLKWIANSFGEKEDRLAEMIGRTGAEIIPLHEKSKI